MLREGIKGHREIVVDEKKTAEAMGSGELKVFATPAVIALAEETAWRSVVSQLEEGQTTVGTKMELSHTSATPIGAKVWCETVVALVDRRRIEFQIEVYDEAGEIAKGKHERFIVDKTKFQKKAEEKFL